LTPADVLGDTELRHGNWLVGAGIGRASGDTTAGVMIGVGVGMMLDIMN
jgi:hypothetical protein